MQKKEQGNTYASLAREADLVRVSEEAPKKEIIFLLENSDIQRSNEPWKILQRYLTMGLYFPGESYKTWSYYEAILSHTGSAEFQHFTSEYNENVYNFSKITIKQIVLMEEWGISTMQEKIVPVNKVNMNFTYWDYIQSFHKIFYYNNEKLKYTWFLKICAKVFTQNLPNWFISCWALHGRTKKIYLIIF